MLNEKLQRVAVVGACGKMGRGIALLVLQEMAALALSSDQTFQPHLYLIDPNEEAYYDLKVYLEQQLTRYAEKNINELRKLFEDREDLVENGVMVRVFVSEALRLCDCTPEFGALKNTRLVFEAAFEEIPLKVSILKKIHLEAPSAWVLTNTSSIPIGLLAKESNLQGKIIGCHFYNPPPVQKLMELIFAEENTELKALALELADRFNKTVVVSKDVAGFIGNGHFSREIVFACQLVDELSAAHPKETAVQIVDSITRDFLLRPMGIFELLDYVGIPIAHHILEIIREYVPDPAVESSFIQELLNAGLLGGQTVEGYPKNGIYRYEQGKIQGIYSFAKKGYEPLKDLSFLGNVPEQLTWKKLQKDPQGIQSYFDLLFASQDQGALLAVRFLRKSFEIQTLLVNTGVAASMKDTSTVLKSGFYHLYSPDEVMR